MKTVRYVKSGIQTMTRPKRAFHGPLHLQIEPTTFCNYSCQTCFRDAVLDGYKHMSLEAFKRVVQQVNPANVILSGLGEPFMNPDYVRMVEYLKKKGIFVRSTTNGSLLNKRIIDALISARLDVINVSLDATCEATYLKVRSGADYKKVMDNILLLNQRKKALRSVFPRLRLSFVIQSDNYREMGGMVLLAKKVGAHSVFFQPMHYQYISDKKESLMKGLTKQNMLREVKAAYRLAKAKGVATNLEDIIDNFSLHWKKYSGLNECGAVCPLPWMSVYVDVEGNVRVCCSMFKNDGIMGNIFRESFRKIWNGKRYVALRKAFKAGKRPYEPCKICVPLTMSDLIRRAVS
ncbi:radical SAM protein [Candidatus Woesearchaeota archaeon]|nr:radical SAM protein [Candidatus Woesearchaeota archaeon]